MFEMRPYRRNQINAWNPFAEMEAFEKRFNDLFNSTPDFKTDITDEGDHFELKADLPGVNKEDIQLNLEGNYLTISTQRHSEHEQKDQRGKYIRCERSYGSTSRSFNVEGIDTEAIHARYENGVLMLTLPKRSEEVSGSKRLEIE